MTHSDRPKGRTVGPLVFGDQQQSIPSSTEAEEAILGAMMMAPRAVEAAENVGLMAEHFYRPSHRWVFEAIKALRDAGQEVDEHRVVVQLRSTPGGKAKQGADVVEVTALTQAGGAAAVMTLAERVPTTSNARAYAQEVVDVATKRRLVEIGHEVARAGMDTTLGVDESIRHAESQLLEVVASSGEKHRRGEAVDTEASIDQWAAAYERRQDHELLERDTLSWGRPELDDRLGRMRPGQLFVTAGWTKHGKTWFCMDVAEAVMEQGARVLIDSGEMEDDELVDRWTAMGGHNYQAVEEGRIPWSVLKDRLDQMRKWQRRTLTGRMSLERLRSQVSRAKLEGRPYRLVVVDHLGLVRPGPGQGRHGRTEFLEDAVAELKALAVEYQFTMLLVSQLSRPPAAKDTHERWLRPPIQSDLKGASGIEQIATSVIFVYRRMVKQTGRFDGQKAVLLFPFHRSRQLPKPLACEFVLPARPGQSSVSAYRFEPVTIETPEPTPEAVAVQEQLTETFGPGVGFVAPPEDDDIPF